jgi:hypothetical protein
MPGHPVASSVHRVVPGRSVTGHSLARAKLTQCRLVNPPLPASS